MINEGQAGFKSGMGVLDNIYAMNYLVNREISRPGGKLITFFDLRTVFDSVDREVLMEAMRRRGVRE